MVRQIRPMAVAASALALSGCVAAMAAGVASMAVQGSQKAPVSNEALKPTARYECDGYAARYGTTHIIDVQQAKVDKIIVWGTVDDGKQKQSFECDFDTKITGFKLRPIRAAQ
ncbi:MAG TPA: hypothetical protein VIV07_03440 [Sphingomicrobium sp.]